MRSCNSCWMKHTSCRGWSKIFRTLTLSESGALKLQLEPTDLAGLAREAVESFAAAAAERGVRMDVDAAHALPTLTVDPVRIREVFGNLLSNALRHTPSGRGIAVVLAALPGAVSVEVRDEGTGIIPEELAHAFNRFFKGSGSRGSGLGLAIAKGLVTAHGGDIPGVEHARTWHHRDLHPPDTGPIRPLLQRCAAATAEPNLAGEIVPAFICTKPSIAS